jgi:hypothetical protein
VFRFTPDVEQQWQPPAGDDAAGEDEDASARLTMLRLAKLRGPFTAAQRRLAAAAEQAREPGGWPDVAGGRAGGSGGAAQLRGCLLEQRLRASLGCHRMPGCLARKAASVAALLCERDAALAVLQECPLAHADAWRTALCAARCRATGPTRRCARAARRREGLSVRHALRDAAAARAPRPPRRKTGRCRRRRL